MKFGAIFVAALCFGNSFKASASSPPAQGAVRFEDDRKFLEYLQRQTFNYFWNQANPRNGLIRDRSDAKSACSIAAVGFGLSGINVAVSHDWITRAQGRDRVLRTLETLYALPQGTNVSGVSGYRGWFYHFLDMETGLRAWNCELSTIDTALLMMGVIDTGIYFDQAEDPAEKRIREVSKALVNRVDWQFVLHDDKQVCMEWRPDKGHSKAGWVGYSEASCMYLLGLGAERDPLPASSWQAWTSGYEWTNAFGFGFVTCPPLFTHQYSHVWIDFRGIADDYMRKKELDYFENSRRATLAHRKYAIENPLKHPNYGKDEWGLTACDGPGKIINGRKFEGYAARGVCGGLDDGTIAPTAAVSSLPFAPEECLRAARHFYDSYGTNLWTTDGFRDAYNIEANWWDPDTLGIDQGPIVLMIENYLNGSVWRRMMTSPIIRRGLDRAGFKKIAERRGIISR